MQIKKIGYVQNIISKNKDFLLNNTLPTQNTIKNKTKTLIFNNKQIKTINDIIKDCPEFLSLISIKLNEKQAYKYEDILKFYESYLKHKKANKYLNILKKYASIKTSNSKMRLNADDIITISKKQYKLYKNYFDIKQTNGIWTNKLINIRFKEYCEFKTAVPNLLKMEIYSETPRFTVNEILKLYPTFYNFPNEVKKLAAIKMHNGTPRFNQEDICNLISSCKYYDGLIELARKENPNGTAAYTTDFIKKFAKLQENSPKDVIKIANSDLLNRLNEPNNQWHDLCNNGQAQDVIFYANIKNKNGEYHFNYHDIFSLLNTSIYKEYSKEINTLLEMKNLTIHDLINLAPCLRQNPENTIKLLNETGRSGKLIKFILDNTEKNDHIEYAIKLMNLEFEEKFNLIKIPDLKQLYQIKETVILSEKLSDDDIYMLYKIFKKYPTEVIELASMSSPSGKRRYNTEAIIKEISEKF